MSPRSAADLADNKAVVQRLVDEVINKGSLDLIEHLYTPDQVTHARGWIAAFRRSFPDVFMETLELIAERDVVIGRFACSATHTGSWLGHPATGRAFSGVAEVNRYRFEHGQIAEIWTLEDNLDRLAQLGLSATGQG